MSGLLGAVAFLSRAPVPGARGDAGPGELAAAVPWFPLVGALIGAACAAVYAAGAEVLPPAVAATLAVGAQMLLTGALHEDGLADVADATGGSSLEERQRILHEPTHGTHGVLALVVSTVARVAALASLDRWSALAALVAAAALARGAAVGLMWAVPPAGGGLAAGHRLLLTRGRTAVGVVGALGLAGLAVSVWAVPAAALAAAVALGLGRWATASLGGVTGDVLGASVLLTEVAVLVLAAGAGPELAWWR